MNAAGAEQGQLRAIVREVLAELGWGGDTAGKGRREGSGGGRREGHPDAAGRTLRPGGTSASGPGHGGERVGEASAGGWSGAEDGARGGLDQQFPRLSARPAQGGLGHTVHEDVSAVETVDLRNDADLAAFVVRLLHLFENPARRDALRSGRLRFRLAPGVAPGSVRPAHRVEKGAVTEAMVVAASRAGARLVLGRRAVLTPLARDRARAAGVEIEKER